MVWARETASFLVMGFYSQIRRWRFNGHVSGISQPQEGPLPKRDGMRQFGKQAGIRSADQRENSMKAILRLATISLLFAGSAFALTGERMPEMTLEKMTPAQRSIAEAIMNGPRGRMSGPFNAWLRNPVLADRLQKVGEYVRFNTSLDKRINEMAILMTARAWGAQYEWYAHAPLALKAGLDPAVLKAIGAGEKPANMKDDEAIVWELRT